MTKRSYSSKMNKGILKLAQPTLQQLIHRDFPYAVMHSCGMAAFYLRKRPEIGCIIELYDVILPNGNAVTEPPAVCFNCKQPVTPADMLNIQKVQ